MAASRKKKSASKKASAKKATSKKAAKKPSRSKAPRKSSSAPKAVASKRSGRWDFETVQSLVELMSTHDLGEVEIAEGDNSIRLRRGSAEVAVGVPYAAPAPMAHAPPPAAVAPVAAEAAPAKSGASGSSEEAITIRSPMVGTYYHAPGPDAAPFVKEGDSVQDETTVCIIEAMKVMNEIKSEKRGVITEILVENGEAVEFDQPLFVLSPS